MAGAALESPLLKAAFAGRNSSQCHPVFAGETHRLFNNGITHRPTSRETICVLAEIGLSGWRLSNKILARSERAAARVGKSGLPGLGWNLACMPLAPEAYPCSGRGRASVGAGKEPPNIIPPAAVLRMITSNSRSGVPGSPHSSSPKVIQCPLLSRCGKVIPARLVVNQVDDDVPHDRTPLFDPWVLIPAIPFPVSSRDHENGFVSATDCFAAFGR